MTSITRADMIASLMTLIDAHEAENGGNRDAARYSVLAALATMHAGPDALAILVEMIADAAAES